MPPKTPAPAPKAQSQAPHTQSAAPKPLPPPEPVVVAPPEPVKVPLEESVRKAVQVRKDVLTAELRKETELEVAREDEVRKGKERISALETEIAEIDAFLARN